MDQQSSDAFDVAFSVPCTHRLRFTSDIFGSDASVLARLLESSTGDPVRIQVWIDESLAAARPDLQQAVARFGEQFHSQVALTGNIQIVPGGEAAKNEIHILERMLRCFHEADLDRRSYVIVIGGGAVLDAVGFAAAIAHRGIRLIRLPSTTLAQADSGIGVKNSVNLFRKKNWVGTFAVPWAVINDAGLLESLPDRDFACGFSEAVKVALLKDADFFAFLCSQADAIRDRRASVCRSAIRDSALYHLKHITRGGDPFEALEARPLDFGHWSAHKLEALSDFSVRHGEAVAIGLAVDCVYSSLVHGFDPASADAVLKCLGDLGLPLMHPLLEDTAIFDGLEEFRQHLGGRLTVTMLTGVGQPIDVHEIDRSAMVEAVNRVRAHAAASDAMFRPTETEFRHDIVSPGNRIQES